MDVKTSIETKTITLQGSAQIVKELFYYSINNILFQREIYPSDTFNRVKKWNVTLMASNDKKVKTYLDSLLKQIEVWLTTKELKKLVVAIVSIETNETVEKWEFDIETDVNISNDGPIKANKYDEESVKNQIGVVIRQITASVSFLPLIKNRCVFDVMAFTGNSTIPNSEWEATKDRVIKNPETTHFRECNTGVHTVKTKVQYQADL
uniref:HORMA domain-containing protein n=1 Tax=Parastrongyloides trichosuri TaxID=131310 RepID=A0A0N4ZSF0_PARTI